MKQVVIENPVINAPLEELKRHFRSHGSPLIRHTPVGVCILYAHSTKASGT